MPDLNTGRDEGENKEEGRWEAEEGREGGREEEGGRKGKVGGWGVREREESARASYRELASQTQ